MKKLKRLLSALTALAISASAFASMVIPASAAEVAISGADYNFEADGSAWTCDQTEFGIAVASDSTLNSKVLKGALAGKNATTTGTVSLPTAITPETDGYVKVTFDWYSKTIGLSDYTETVLVDASGKQIVSISEAYSGRSTAPTNVVSVNGTEVTTSSNATISAFTWYTVTAMVDFGTKQVSSLSFTPSGTSTVSATLTDLAFKDKDASGIAGIYINSHKGNGNINLDWAIDNFKAYNITETFVAEFTVNVGSDPLEGAKVTIDSKDYLTDATGKAYIRLADGSHNYTISKGGYEAASGSNLTGTVSESSKTASAVMQIETYTQVATKVTVGGGQELIAAASGDTPATSAAFTVAVKDQFDFDMSSGYTTAWAVYPTGTTTANANVTIADGVVSVAKGYTATNEAAVFDVVATVTDANDTTKTATNKKTIIIANSDVLVYDMDTSFTASGAKSKEFDITDVTIPTGGLRLSFNYFKGKYDNSKDTSYGRLSFMNGEDTVLYFDDKNAGLTLYTDGENSLALGTTARDTAYPTELSIIGSQLVVKFNDGDYQIVQFDEAPAQITSIVASTSQDGGSGTGATELVISSKLNVDTTGVNILGDDEFAVIAGKTVTRQYTAKPYISEASDNFTWTVTAAAGVSIDPATGVLSVADTATPGKVTVTATSGTKTGSLEVDIKAAQAYTADVTYPMSVAKGKNAKLVVNKITDTLGDDVTDYFTPTWSIEGAADADQSVNFTGLTEGDAVAIYATYDGTALSSVTTEDITVPAGGSVSLTAPSEAMVYIWDSLDGIKPLAAAQKAPKAALGDTQLAAIGSRSGDLITNETADSGTVTVKLNITGSDATPATYSITVADYSKFVTPEDAGEISVADIVTYGATSFNVVLDDGSVITKTASDNKITLATADFGDSAEAEIIPNYKFDLGGASESGYVKVTGTKENGYGFATAPTAANGTGTGIQSKGVDLNANSFAVDLPDGRYDITIYKALKGRSHLRVNGYMTVTEADFIDGDDNAVDPLSGPGVYTKLDANVTNGVAVFTADNWDNSTPHLDPLISAVEITKKSDEFQPRKTHVWIAGDSTVCIYRPSPTTDNFAPGTRRTGWGQLLQNYLADSVIVDDFAHSGDWADNWYNNTFPSVLNHAEAGDYLIIQFGINDRTRTPDQAVMKAALVNMVDQCRAKGVIPVIQTPELCISQYGDWSKKDEHDKPDGSGHAGYFKVNKTVAQEKNTLFIDLGDISATMWATMGKTWVTQNYFVYNSAGVTDNQHMSYQGAKLVASMVATEILDQKTAGKTGAAGETFAGIPVNAKVQANVTYTDASDNTQKTIERQAAEFKATVLN